MKTPILFFGLLLLPLFASYAQVTLISQGSTWKYKADGSNQGTAWKNVSFNDQSWSSGKAELGFGDGGETTVIGAAANGFITFYFRKKFVVSTPTQYEQMLLSVWRDDGAIVYVNGQEVFRTNMPKDSVNYTTLASTNISDDGNTPQTIVLPPTLFVNDTNTIAVEVHQQSATSTDLSFDLSLLGQKLQITRGPYITIADSIGTIRWRTSIPTNAKVTIGALTFVSQDTTTEHVVHLKKLFPNTNYNYLIGSTSKNFPSDTNYHFRTAPLRGRYVRPVTVVGFGDFGISSNNQNQVEKALPQTADVWQWYGDNAYFAGSAAEYEDHVFGYHYKNHFPKLNLMPSRGNHDGGSSSAVNQTGPYFDYFTVPTQGQYGGVASNTKAYYSYTIGHTHHVVLESFEAEFRNPKGAMANWLRKDLEADTSRWCIVYFHHPPFSKGTHDSDAETEMVEMRQNILPILEQYDVDLVLGGHSHGYERSYLIHQFYGSSNDFKETNMINPGSGFPERYHKSDSRGTVYAVVGTGGMPLSGTGTHKAMAFSTFSHFGYAKIILGLDSLQFQFIDTTQQIIDQFIITKPPCPTSLSITPPFTLPKVALYDASKTITATNTVGRNSTIWYSAGQSVEFLPGFSVVSGAVFKAFIKGCRTNSP